jgi:hypothetical protein
MKDRIPVPAVQPCIIEPIWEQFSALLPTYWRKLLVLAVLSYFGRREKRRRDADQAQRVR